jgi:hypothetical protein
MHKRSGNGGEGEDQQENAQEGVQHDESCTILLLSYGTICLLKIQPPLGSFGISPSSIVTFCRGRNLEILSGNIYVASRLGPIRTAFYE